MNILTFKYTKANATASQRVLAVLIKPNTMYEGIDISELEMLEQAMFAEQLDTAYNEYLDKVNMLKQEFDVVNNYRRFDPVKMTDIVSEQI
jgi:outer membrane protein assembly factor BamA